MSISIMPIGGKYENDGNPIVKGIAVEEDGNVMAHASREWKNEVVRILDLTDPIVTEGSTYKMYQCTEVDLSNVGAVSLRVNNDSTVPVTLQFLSDWYSHDYWMRDADGSFITKTIPARQTYVMITPDDIPIMQWLKKLNIGAKFTESGTGNISIWAVLKG